MYSSLNAIVQLVSAASASVATKPILSVAFRAIKAVISCGIKESLVAGSNLPFPSSSFTHKLHHCPNARTLLLLVPRNGLATQQPTLLGGIPVELDRAVAGRVAVLGQDAERLEDADGAGAVVVGAWRGQEGEEVVRRVLVRSEDGLWLGKVADLGFEARDDGRLGEGVSEIFQRDVGAERGAVNDLCPQIPLSKLSPL